MFEGGVHTRFGKRIDFPQMSSIKDISDEYVREMQDKFARTQRDFTFTRETEKDIIRGVREQMAGDRKRKYELLMHKREEFIKDNNSYLQAKKERKERER